MTPITSKSGNLTHAQYNPTNQQMTIRFQSGTEYAYQGVEASDYAEFEATFADEGKSTGGFFARVMRKKYKGEKINEVKTDE